MSDEIEDEEFEELEIGSYPDVLSCQEGQIHFGGDAQAFLAHWAEKMGSELVGSALIVGESLSVAVLHSETGESLTPLEIAKRAKAGRMRSVQ